MIDIRQIPIFGIDVATESGEISGSPGIIRIDQPFVLPQFGMTLHECSQLRGGDHI